MKVLIVDDEAPARDRLRQLLADDETHEVIGEAGNGRDAITAVNELAPDVVLLDIRMPGLNGIEAANHLNGLDEPPAIIFTTAYDEYAIEAFEANAIGYVLKPVRRARLEQALKQASRISPSRIDEIAVAAQLPTQRTHLSVRVKDELKLIPVDAITHCVADQKYVRLHHTDGEHLTDESLKSLEEEFSDLFVRIHRGAIVALKFIDGIQKLPDGKTRVNLRDIQSDDDSLIISRRHLSTVRRRLKGR